MALKQLIQRTSRYARTTALPLLASTASLSRAILSTAALAVTTLGVAMGAASASQLNDSIFNKPNPTRADLALQAYVWGWTLLAQQRTVYQHLASAYYPGYPPAILNQQFDASPTLATPADVYYIAYNNDTLYSNGFLNLSQTPVVLSVPATGSRYFSLEFQSSYLDVFNYVGTRLGDTAGGQYLITGPSYTGTIPSGYVRTIQSPTNSVWLLGRTYVNGPTDVSAANAVQTLYTLSYPNGQTPPNPFAPVTIPVPPPGNPSQIRDLGASFYAELNSDLAYNLPPSNPDQSALLASFKAIGIGPGANPADLPTDAEAQAAIALGQQLMLKEVVSNQTNVNNWTVSYELGNYGTNYLLRSAMAQFGCQGCQVNIPQEAIYFTGSKDVSGDVLNGANSYAIRFLGGALPPVRAEGFWSITLYDSNGILVANPIDRYSLGSSSPLEFNADGSLTIYLSNTAPALAKDLANWLPAPLGDFSLTLRTYIPGEALLDQSYKVPGIEKQASSVPGPLPLFGVGAVFSLSRQMRRRIVGSRQNGFPQNGHANSGAVELAIGER